MEINTRKAICDSLENYDYLAKEGDFIEVTEWTNGDGYDICINDEKLISLTSGMIVGIGHLVNCLTYGDFDKQINKLEKIQPKLENKTQKYLDK